ncbi:polysialyltransferase family glycosyltransferase [Halorussus salinisoli]|uniref:polysialyltransferase family glycosyltransferase n=1 Tax=Halorussus salinisoli TaxID=2558242 RepID=UPI0010C2166E|nr:polysialyltransferase family glycosyltransferase [Halorussus salinisoli]
MKSLYIAHTPYHVLLASTLAASAEEDRERHLVSVLDSDMAELLRSLELDEDPPFDHVYSIPGTLDTTGRRGELRKKVNSLRVRRYVNCERPDELYTFNDHRPESQAAFDALGDDVRRIYVEDGTAAYARFPPADEWTRLGYLKAKLFYGPWRRNPRLLGTTDWIDEVRLVFPDHALPEVRANPVVPIPRESVLVLADADWFRRYVEQSGVDETLDRLDALVFVTHSNYVGDISNYVELLETLVDRLTERGFRVGLKYHPREKQKAFEFDRDDVEVLSRGVSAEVLYVADPTLDFVVGGMSTALLTARWLLDDATVVSLTEVLQQSNRELPDVFERLGIHVPESRSEVAQVPIRR